MKVYSSLNKYYSQYIKVVQQTGFSTILKEIKKQRPDLFNDPQRKDPTTIRQQVVDDGGEPPEADG